MTINVQATRQSAKEIAPGHDDYQEKEDRRRSLVPLVFLLIVGSCTAYLKSFLPVKLEASEDRRQPRGSDDEQQETIKEDVLTAAEEPDPERPAGAKSSGLTEEARMSARAGDERVNSGSTDFSARSRTGKSEVGTGSGESPKVANDNRPQPRHDAPLGGGGVTGGGGGGGGGGGDDRHPKPRDPPPPDHRNRAPRVSGAVHLPDVVACNGLAISMAALLAGAIDPDGDKLTVVGIYSSSGTLTRTDEGWEFDRDNGMVGEVKLTYAISDGSQVVMQTAFFNVIDAPPIVGTEGDDILLGTQCAETIVGIGGDDNIDARGGDDRISGDAGDDHILAGAGHDVVHAGDGNDIVFAGAGNDIVFGGAGNDRLYGEDGDDTLLGEDGNDHLDGGAGRDILLAGAGDDTLDGGAGHDTLDGGDGADRMAGGDGHDVMTGGAGADVLVGDAGNDILADGDGSDVVSGGAGDDRVLASADAADDSFHGGAGNDTLDYSSAVSAVSVDLAAGKASGADIGKDAVSEFENVTGGAGDDTLIAGAMSASIEGGSGNDTIVDGVGSDKVDGGSGDDVVLASADAADDRYDGNSGNDILDYSATTITVTIDLREGTAKGVEIGRDLIEGFEEIIAGSGDDVIHAGKGSVVLTGGAGDDCFTFEYDDDEDTAPNVVKKITDFTVGDKIVAATYQITIKDGDDAEEQVADLFEQIYLDEENSGHHARSVRFRFEELADGKYTAIDVAHGDDENVMTIEVAGHHQLQFTAFHS